MPATGTIPFRLTPAIIAGLLCCNPLAIKPSHAQQANDWQQALAVGAYFARGDYGELVDTELWYFPLSYEANRGPWGFQLLVPHLRVTGLGNVLINIGGVTQSVAGNEVTTSSGVGDSIASLIYRLDPWSATAPFVDLRLDVKIPTADAGKALGTGETDYSMQVDVSQAFGDSAWFATLGYNTRADSPLYPGLQNSLFTQVGFATPLTDRFSAGLFYDYRQAASEFSPESHELVPYFSYQLNDNWSFTGFTTWGFTDASADIAVLGQLRFSW